MSNKFVTQIFYLETIYVSISVWNRNWYHILVLRYNNITTNFVQDETGKK